jgi:hypothetical protein
MPDDEPDKVTLSVYLEEELKSRLQAEADLDGRSLSNLATRILEAWVKEKGEAQ